MRACNNPHQVIHTACDSSVSKCPGKAVAMAGSESDDGRHTIISVNAGNRCSVDEDAMAMSVQNVHAATTTTSVA